LVESDRVEEGLKSGGDSEPRVCVIVLTFNQRDRTLRFLASLHESWDEPSDVLVWDNGSEDGTLEAVSEAFPAVSIHRHESNLGVASGRNAAAALALETVAPTHLLFLDNDMELVPGFLESLLGAIQGDPEVGQVQAKLLYLDNREIINDGGGCRINFLTGETVPVGCGEVDRGQFDEVKSCISCGGAMMVRSSVFEELGGFDSSFDPFGPEDLDFSLRMQDAGYRSLYVPSAIAYHAVSHTFGAGYTEEYARHKTRHWMMFLRRHGTGYQKLGFFVLGAPYLALKVFSREARRGNLAAVRGIFRGFLDLFQR
jgi:GT2 family glycosyltransferase